MELKTFKLMLILLFIIFLKVSDHNKSLPLPGNKAKEFCQKTDNKILNIKSTDNGEEIKLSLAYHMILYLKRRE